MKRALIGSALALLGLIVALLLALALVLGTERGAGFIAGQATQRVAGLTIGSVQGSFRSGLVLTDVRWASDALEVTIARLDARAALGSLLRRAPLRIERAELRDVVVRRLEAPRADSDAGTGAPRLPAIAVADLSVDRLTLNGFGAIDRTITRLTARGGIGGTGIALDAIDIDSADLDAAGALALDLGQRFALSRSDLAIRYRDADARDWRGTLQATPQEGVTGFKAALESPVTATLAGHVSGDRATARLTFDLPEQSGAVLGFDEPLGAALALSIDDSNLALEGHVSVAGRGVAIDAPAISRSDEAMRFDDAVLDADDGGRITVSGTLPMVDAASWALRADIERLAIKRASAAPLIVDGALVVTGARATPTFAPALTLRAEGFPDGRLTGAITRERDGIVLDGVVLAVARGSARASGRLGGDGAQALAVRIDDFDPALLAPAWPGAVSANATWRGARAESGLDGDITLDGIRGELRGRALAGSGSARIAGGRFATGALTLSSGSANLRVEARDALAVVDATLAAPDLADVWPGATGALDATLSRSQRWQLGARGSAIDVAGLRIASLTVDADAAAEPASGFRIAASGDGVALGEREFGAATLSLAGSARAHRGELAFDGDTRGRIAVAGGLDAASWRGTLAAIDVSRRDGRIALAAPAALSVTRGRVVLTEACVDADRGRACVTIDGDAHAGEVTLALTEIAPQALIAFVPEIDFPLAGGAFGGRIAARWAGGRMVALDGNLDARDGRIALPERRDLELGFSTLGLRLEYADGAGRVDGEIAMVPDGRIVIAGPLTATADGAIGYAIDVELALSDLTAIEAFTTAIAEPEGALSGTLTITGAGTARPAIEGALSLTGFTAQVPDYAIRVRDGALELRGTGERLELTGSLRSGDGTIAIGGVIEPGAETAAALTLSGEGFRIANTPTLMVIASPDLRLTLEKQRWQLSGDIGIPRARVDAEQLDGGVSASRDVIVVDDPEPPQASRPWRARVAVTLGDDVRLEGFGFDGALEGKLIVRQRQGSPAVATGEVEVDGTYRAYGQRLAISEGRLRWAASPLGEPTLDLRAERTVRGETVAVSVTGNAAQPSATIVGAPGMSEQNALALLVTGRGAGGVGDGGLSEAAAALGAVGSDVLTGNLRERLRLDEFGVSGDTALDGEAFTIGKYLSPRLYVGYGIGLLTKGEVFTARFLLTERVDIEASSGESQRAALNYRIER